MLDKFKKKIFTIKNNKIELENNSIVFHNYSGYIATNIILDESINIPVFHNDNNIEILNDFLQNINILSENYKTIHMIIDKTCFITLKNNNNNHNDQSLYFSYENIHDPHIIINNNNNECVLYLLVGAVISSIITFTIFKKFSF
jgi:hypothetical protein